MRSRAALCLALALAFAPGCAPAPGEPAGPRPAGAGPRSAVASKGGREILRITEGPGVLIDSNAPPPPPGTQPARHPFVGASCGGGQPALCSQARDLLNEATSYDDFLKKLKSAGFTVAPSGG